MDKLTMLFKHFKQAQNAVAKGVRLIAAQERLINELRRDGHDITQGEKLLSTFRRTQELHEIDFATVATEIAELTREAPDVDPPSTARQRAR